MYVVPHCRILEFGKHNCMKMVIYAFYLSDCEGCGPNEICTQDLTCICNEGFIRDAAEICSGEFITCLSAHNVLNYGLFNVVNQREKYDDSNDMTSALKQRPFIKSILLYKK